MKNSVKKINVLTVLIACFVSLSSLNAQSSLNAPQYYSDTALQNLGYEVAAQTEELVLYLDEVNGFFAVRDLGSGYVWYSVPLDWEADTVSSGFNKNAVPSIISIRTKDDNGSFFPANSYINVVKRKSLEVKEIENGFRLVMFFKREGIEVPVDITIEDRSLCISVPLGEIWEDEEDVLRVLDFTVTPYFGCAPSDEEGYMFVPDGSGAIINFTNRNSEEMYKQYVYGRDHSVIPVMKKTKTEDVLLPVFGMKREGAGFLAVFDQSAERGFISAETAFQRSSYNAVNASCVVRDYDVFSFRERTGTPRDIKIFEKGNFSDEVFSVRYIFLNEEEANYVGMAKAYRNYLQENNKFPVEKTKTEQTLFLNFLGAAEKKQPVAGIPLNVIVSYTPFNDVSSIIDRLEKGGIKNFIVNYDGWVQGGLFGKYPAKANPESSSGGNKDFLALSKTLKEKGIPFYAGLDFVNLYSSDIKHMKELTTNRAINRMPVAIPEYALSTFDEKNDSDPYWILKAPSIQKFVQTFNSSLKKYPDLNLSPSSLADTLGSDFSPKNGTSRTQTAQVFENLIATFSNTRKLLFSRPFSYALGYTSFASDLPVVSSRFDIEDYSVPFYQIVLRGYIPFSNLAANRDTGYERYFLSLLETGAMPSYVWVTKNEDKMRDTLLESFMNVYAEDWIEESIDLCSQVFPVLSRIENSEIIGHSVYDNGLRETVYDNGLIIVTNPSLKDLTHESGKPVKSLSYITLTEGFAQ